MDFYSLLITPVQRIPRYTLLLKELLKHTPNSHPDYNDLALAYEKIMVTANVVNDSMKSLKVSKVYDSIVDGVKGILVNLFLSS